MGTQKEHYEIYHNPDRVKVLYGQIMMAAMPMFDRIDEHDQQLLVNRLTVELMKKIQMQEACKRDAHILVIDEEETGPENHSNESASEVKSEENNAE